MHLFLLSVISVLAQGQDKDTDKDGLSDFQETHKYFTDPRKADSDGDGTPDGDWNERREYTYTVRSILQVMAPYSIKEMNDDNQDARVLEERDGILEVEVVHYPLNTCTQAIEANPNWRRDSATMKEYIRPGVTTNWDREMKEALVAGLKEDGIDVTRLTDKEVVEKVSAWLMKRARFEDGFTTFAVVFRDGKPHVAPGQEAAFERELKKTGRTAQEQWDRELFGKGMFENRVRGSCTSSSIYLATGLRAVGIPTRTVICVPVVDASDPREVEFVRRGLKHHQVRRTIEESVATVGNSWASHTFNEVYVGKRWRRLNYARLGQSILDAQYLGLMTHVLTYNDHAEANLAPWGLRNARKVRDDVFGHSNPYSCISLSDRFGKYARIENPPVKDEHTQLTISRVYWYHTDDKPAIVKMRLADAETAGHLVMHVEEGFVGKGPGQYKRFYSRVGKEFMLRAKGHHDIRTIATRGYWTDVKNDVMDFYLKIRPKEFSRMEVDVAYELIPVHADETYRWSVKSGVTIRRARDEDGD